MTLDTDTQARIMRELILTGSAPSARTPEEKDFAEDVLRDIKNSEAVAKATGRKGAVIEMPDD